jgi:trimethylamine---corrinoid protein Co-methyltransferase
MCHDRRAAARGHSDEAGAHDGGSRTVAELERQPLEPLRPSFSCAHHTAEQLDRLKQATLDVLERVGVRFPSDKALDVLAEHGALVDREARVARFPADLVLSAMSTAPRTFTLGARDPSCEIPVGDGATYCTSDGCGPRIIDPLTGDERRSTKADVESVSRMLDYLGSMCFWWPTVSAGDYGETSQLHEIEAGFRNTVKHLQGMVQGERAAELAVEMATVIAGSAEELRRRPVLSDLIGTISPLMQDTDGIEAAMVFARAGVPVCFVTMPTLGTTAPATRAGSYAMAAAELVSASVLVQCVAPGAPVIHSYIPSYVDPRTGEFLSFPRDHRGGPLTAELPHHWGVPAEGTSCGTDSAAPATWQSGMEEAVSLVEGAHIGADLMPSIGLLGTYTTFSAEHLILGDDIYHRARFLLKDISLDDDELALDVIAAVGPGGHYLGQRHTRRHMRGTVVRGLTHEFGPDGGYRDVLEVARERALELWRDYRPQPLAEDKAAELARIAAAAERELKG